MSKLKVTLPVIVISQFCCTSLWFAGNGVMSDLIINFNLSDTSLGYLTSAVQLGFIIGTLLFAILTIVDRFPPSKVFLVCAIFGALINASIAWEGNNLLSLLVLRFLTGFFLAGIYPVGMKIAADGLSTFAKRNINLYPLEVCSIHYLPIGYYRWFINGHFNS
ncbi:hypothetical protein AB832_03340 [Flavobacteriaceae bacterium (ex Bugula neritina AB1)]|nr:hypothetical protein AB832_03340 [Flavobacteriaceae bacterium (ex Bugula neritina AB1)]